MRFGLRRHSLLTPIVLIAAVGVSYSSLLQPVGCNQTAHYSLIQSLSDGTPRIDAYRPQSCDIAYIDGHFYAAKAPGLAMLTVPFYAALELAGSIPANPGLADGYPQAMLELPRRAIWQVHLWGVVLPALMLLVLFWRIADRLEPGFATTATVILALGTLLFVRD